MRIKSRRKEGVPIQLDHIYTGDCLEVLKTLPDESVHCCITSPPYYALRDYGVDGQIGREATPKEYISRLTEVFTEVRRVLRSDGTLWLNISDTYAGKGNQGSYVDAKNPKGRNGQAVALNYKVEGCKPKDMIGIPWMLAFSLRDSGWYLRNDIIWMKENPMPESVKDRCARCYEHIFLFSKSRKYFFDYKAISEPIAPGTVSRLKRGVKGSNKYGEPIPGQAKQQTISLLAKYGMTEADAWRLCEKYDMLSPCYQHSKRNGCWFCPNASTSELSHMVNRHPDLFEKLIEWEHTDNLYHRRLTRTETPSEIKARLSGKSQPEFSISNQ